MSELTDFDIQLLRTIQQPLPICRRPFAKVAELLDTSEQAVLETIQKLKADGFIRRFRPQLNYRALGRIAALVCAHVPNEKFDAVAAAVSALEGVSHNYCRNHHYNLWFTLQAGSLIAIDVTLDGLREEFDVAFHSLPATRLFKLDVRFDPAGPQAMFEQPSATPASEMRLSDVPPVTVELTDAEKQVLGAIQSELPVTEMPFDAIEELPESIDVLEVLKSVSGKGVLRKIAAVLNYTKLGYTANAMFCAEVPSDRISTVGADLAGCAMVSHCYERKTFDGWPFNFYAMCHAGSLEQIAEMTESACIAHNITHTQLLTTERELKKKPVKIDFE